MRVFGDGASGRPGWLRLLAWTSLVLPSVAVVAIYGELSVQAFFAVLVPGVMLSGVALSRRAGSATQPSTGSARPWLGWISVLALWEGLTFVSNGKLPTLSDLTDPLLAEAGLRATAMVIWLAGGLWLVTRPTAGDS